MRRTGSAELVADLTSEVFAAALRGLVDERTYVEAAGQRDEQAGRE